MTAKLILLRHGESEWNSKNLFTGWVDVDLNEKGEGEARHAADLLKQEDLLPDICLLYTSPSPRDKRQSRMPSSA